MEELDRSHWRLRHRRRISNLAMSGQRAIMGKTSMESTDNDTYGDEHERRKDTITEPSGITKLPLEILQQICLYLDFWDLLRMRGVSRVWNRSIPGSFSPLRKTLFLAPLQGINPSTNALHPATKMEFSIKLERRIEPGHRPAMDYRIIPIWFSSKFPYDSGPTYNPLVRKIDKYIRIFTQSCHSSAETLSPCTHKVGLVKRLACRQRVEKGRELWEQMYTSTPPVCEVEVHCSYIGGSEKLRRLFIPGSARGIHLYDEQGVRLGDFVRVLDQMIANVLQEIEGKWPS